MTTNQRRETWLTLLAQSGDQDALNELLRGVQEPLYRYVLSLTRQSALAEDILQDVFIRICRKLRWLREPELFRAWAYRIASRETFRHFKRERIFTDRTLDESVLETLPAPSGETFAPDLLAQLPCLVAELSPASRAVIILHYLHELSLDEVSAALDIPIGTVKSRLAYGLESLRKRFQKLDL
jgi:RNA polymerase sigma-70 factor (ECF subfamily)